MTNDNPKPASYFFTPQIDRPRYIGPAFRYMTRAGSGILFNGQHYAASPPKANPEHEERT